MEAKLKNGNSGSGGSANDEKLRVLTQQLDLLNQTVKQLQAKLKEGQAELVSKTKAIESSHLLNKKLDKEVQQLKEEVRITRELLVNYTYMYLKQVTFILKCIHFTFH